MGMVYFANAFIAGKTFRERLPMRLADSTQDKFAASHGYSSELSTVLSKIPAAASETKIDWLYSLYHNSAPQISERLEALEKLRKGEEDAISLPTAVNEKV
jgi:hypothetical protein